MKLERLGDIWVDIKYFIEDHPITKWLMGGVVVLIVLFIGVKVINTGKEDTEIDVAEEQEEVIDYNNQEVVGVKDETVHILTHPEQYPEDVVDRAYHESLTTYDNAFVEDRTFIGSELENGVYLYHEKAHDEFREVAEIAQQVYELGVPVRFYTPQFDQSVASISNHTQVVEGRDVTVFAVIVRDGEVDEKIESIEGVIKYLGGVIDDNTQ